MSMCVCVSECVRESVCVYVCVRERETEREKKKVKCYFTGMLLEPTFQY